MPSISIIHPSRQRPHLAAQTANKWLSSAKHPEQIEYIMSLDTDDNVEAYEQYLGALKYDILYCVNDNKNAVQAINIAAKASTGNIIISVSDDFLCPVHWDEYLLTQLKDKSDYIVKTDDGYQPWIITLPIMDRAYYNRFGYVYNPEFQHMFVDTEMTAVADLTERKIKLPIIFKHQHYSVSNTPMDSVSQKANFTWEQGEELYLKRLKDNFGFDKSLKIDCDQSHKDWLKTKGVVI